MSSEAIVSIDIQGKLPKVASGKVRDLFAIDDETLLFVASDRISAYDVVMENVSLWKSPRAQTIAPNCEKISLWIHQKDSPKNY